MTPARKIAAPPAPASHTRAVEPLSSLRARAHRLLAALPAEVFALRDQADARRVAAAARKDHGAPLEHAAADRLDREASALDAAAEELRWLMSLEA